MRSERNRNKKQLSLRNQKKVWRQEAEKSVWTKNGNGQQTIKKSREKLRKNIKFQCLTFFERDQYPRKINPNGSSAHPLCISRIISYFLNVSPSFLWFIVQIIPFFRLSFVLCF